MAWAAAAAVLAAAREEPFSPSFHFDSKRGSLRWSCSVPRRVVSDACLTRALHMVLTKGSVLMMSKAAIGRDTDKCDVTLKHELAHQPGVSVKRVWRLKYPLSRGLCSAAGVEPSPSPRAGARLRIPVCRDRAGGSRSVSHRAARDSPPVDF